MLEENEKIEQVSPQDLPEDEMLPAELNLLPLKKETNEVLNNIVKAESVDELKSYTDMFNFNMAKKNAVRIARLQNLLDEVDEQAIKRFENSPGEFSNKEIIDYMKTVQEQINSSKLALDSAGEKPMIQINNQKNEVNINMENSALKTRESKERVINAVQALLQQMSITPSVEEGLDIANEEDLLYNSNDGDSAKLEDN